MSGAGAPSALWRLPERHAMRRPRLLARTRLLAAIRRHFDAQGFIEVDPAALQASPGNETHLHGYRVDDGAGGPQPPLYLHTSPEFAMKKLLAAGETRIYALSHVFRARERSPLHHPEFVMLEWYRAGAAPHEAMADCAALLRLAARVAADAGVAPADGLWRYRDRVCDPYLEPERLPVTEAFARHAGLDLARYLPQGETADAACVAAFRDAAAAIGVRVSADDGWSDVFSRVLSERVEPHLGAGRATLLCDYPASEAALARRRADDPRFAERFETYACGVELANGFGELTDAAEQRRRFAADMDEKARIYGERYPVDEDFLDALTHMPEACGVALGVDRLAMLATGARRVDEVIWTPVAQDG
ncbi:EF-P lysine aminoacylase EpmA [Camelimonas abortus]|uniref:EF-P lysine aminoacylase EpmA n=1 Tax=Camelimonas abortus TaxID=1017184 RepID=A0ABV7LDL2_9HYPH